MPPIFPKSKGFMSFVDKVYIVLFISGSPKEPFVVASGDTLPLAAWP